MPSPRTQSRTSAGSLSRRRSSRRRSGHHSRLLGSLRTSLLGGEGGVYCRVELRLGFRLLLQQQKIDWIVLRAEKSPAQPAVSLCVSRVTRIHGCGLLGEGGHYRRQGSAHRNVERQRSAAFCFQQLSRPLLILLGLHTLGGEGFSNSADAEGLTQAKCAILFHYCRIHVSVTATAASVTLPLFGQGHQPPHIHSRGGGRRGGGLPESFKPRAEAVEIGLRERHGVSPRILDHVERVGLPPRVARLCGHRGVLRTGSANRRNLQSARSAAPGAAAGGARLRSGRHLRT